MDINPAQRCPICTENASGPFFRLHEVPIYCNVQFNTREEALAAPRGNIDLYFCDKCGHIFNGAFDPCLLGYGSDYENSLHFSDGFNRYASKLASHLIATYGIRNKVVTEIGCGKGDFLRMLCLLGDNRGIGFDPSYEPQREEGASEPFAVIRDLFRSRHAEHAGDLVVCRHVLEHLFHPIELLKMLSAVPNTTAGRVLYFEVPNSLFTLKKGGVWDILYEHYSYFSSDSLRRAFEDAAFEVNAVYEEFGTQFLCIEASARTPHSLLKTPARLDELPGLVKIFQERHASEVQRWEELAGSLRSRNKRVIVWGGGTKGVMFLNTQKQADAIECVVDINPHKQGRFVAGTGHPIIPPALMIERKPDVIIVMNAQYADEIMRMCESLSVNAQLMNA